MELHIIVSAEGTSPEHPLRDYFVRRYAWVLDLARRAFEQAAAEGQLRPGVDPASAARTLGAIFAIWLAFTAAGGIFATVWTTHLAASSAAYSASFSRNDLRHSLTVT